MVTKTASLPKLICEFFKFMIEKVSQKPTQFNVKKGFIKHDYNSNKRIIVSIKDPFIKYINHGSTLQSKEMFR